MHDSFLRGPALLISRIDLFPVSQTIKVDPMFSIYAMGGVKPCRRNDTILTSRLVGFSTYSSTSSLSFIMGSLKMQWLLLETKRFVSARHNPEGDGRRGEAIRRNRTPLLLCKTRIHGCSACPLASTSFS